LTMSENFAVLEPTDEVKDESDNCDCCFGSASAAEDCAFDSTADSFGVSVHIVV
jgi:hypothetical protein